MEDCAAILRIAAAGGGTQRRFGYRGRECNPFAEPERISVADAFARFAGIDADGNSAGRS